MEEHEEEIARLVPGTIDLYLWAAMAMAEWELAHFDG